jgi:hypothetical protein
MSLRESVEAIVDQIVAERLAMRAAYPYRVETQHADGSLDLIPEAGPMPPLTKVPITYGEPGVTATVRKGARVFVEFASGDAAQPMVTGWASGSVTLLTLAADSIRLDGDRPIAREGDSVVVLVTPAAAGQFPTLASGAIPLAGYILKGSSKAKAG